MSHSPTRDSSWELVDFFFSFLQPSPLAVSPNPLTPQPKQPIKLVPMFRFGNGRCVHFQGCHHLRQKDIKSITKILGARSMRTPFLAGNKFFCSACYNLPSDLHSVFMRRWQVGEFSIVFHLVTISACVLDDLWSMGGTNIIVQ